MLNIDVEDIELLVMEDQIHLTITGTVCALFFGVVCWFFSTREDLVVEEVAMLRKLTGREGKSRQPIQLGPHSYMTLIFSIMAFLVILAIIWLVTITPFEKLYKSTPLYKLVKILINSPDLELEEEGMFRRQTPEQTARHQQILNTCMELERRMCRLEQCLTPLARSLQNLSDVIDSRRESRIADLPEQADVEVTDEVDGCATKSDSGSLCSPSKDPSQESVLDFHQGTEIEASDAAYVKDFLDFEEKLPDDTTI